MDLATDCRQLYVARVSGRHVVVGTKRTSEAPAALMDDCRIAVSPLGTIAIAARTGDDMAYACLMGQPWVELGPSSKLQGLAWIDGRPIAARVVWTTSELIEQTIDTAVVRRRPCDSSQGILYYDETSRDWVIKSQAVTSVGRYKLIKAVRRGPWYCGQATNPDRIVIVKADTSVAFRACDQVETPRFVVYGDTLACIGPKGVVLEFRPPYPTTDTVTPPPVVVPPKPVPPKEPPVELPDHAAYIAKRCKELGLKQVNGGNNDATRDRTFTILNQIVAELHAADPGIGLLEKTAGNRWRDRAIDIMTWLEPSGVCHHWDVIGDGEGADGDPTPAYRYVGVINAGRWKAPYPVGAVPVPKPPAPQPPAPKPPDDDDLPSDLQAIAVLLDAVASKLAEQTAAVQGLNARIDKVEAALIAALAESRKPRPVTLNARILGTVTGTIGAPQG